MTSYSFRNINEIDDESKGDIRLINKNEATYIEPACKKIDSKTLGKDFIRLLVIKMLMEL